MNTLITVGSSSVTFRLLCVAAALAVASSVLAQAPAPSQERTPQPAAPTTADHAGAQDDVQRRQESAWRQAALVLDRRRATGIIGKNVDTPAGDNIGEVKDLILDDNGKATHALISYGGAAGVNAKEVAVPWKTVMSMALDDRIVMDRARLQNAPELPEDLTRRGWSREIDRYWDRVRAAAADALDAGGSSPDAPERR